MVSVSAHRRHGLLILGCQSFCHSRSLGGLLDFCDRFASADFSFGYLRDFTRHTSQEVDMTMWPNKSPEPTAVGHRRSAVAAHVVSRRWLSFFR
jgi:hypothetical protein